MKFRVTERARQDIERQQRWWTENRDKAPHLFLEELAAAEQHLTTLPESGQPWRIRKKHVIRRWLLEKTEQHLYYVYRQKRQEVLVVALSGARRSGGPKL